eukprot:GHRQ01011354.1.p3 GENE.GHRQ01011354.1~~GHRQ01011354.1.p3  ORF type:complete len:121 (-),score=3.54 GHRQ01011354.1:21-383(-)
MHQCVVRCAHCRLLPTRSLGIRRSSEPCFRNTFPAVCEGLMPTPSFVIMALVCAGTLNSSAANFSTAVKGASSGTLKTLKGSLGSDVRVILNVTFDMVATDSRLDDQSRCAVHKVMTKVH